MLSNLDTCRSKAWPAVTATLLFVLWLPQIQARAADEDCFRLAAEAAKSTNTIATYCRAVKEGCLVELTYKDDPLGQARTMHPYAVGTSKRDNILLFGEQLAGYSKSAAEGSGQMPGWRNFNLRKITGSAIGKASSEFHAPDPAELKAMKSYVCKHPQLVVE
jgi:hypothetical protein